MTDRELLELIVQKVTKMDGDINEIKSDIKELKLKQQHMETKLGAIAEQTAQLTEFRTEVVSRLDSNAEIQKSLLEMYGGHEAEIRALRRRPV